MGSKDTLRQGLKWHNKLKRKAGREINLTSNALRDKSFCKFVRQIQVGDSKLTAQIDWEHSCVP